MAPSGSVEAAVLAAAAELLLMMVLVLLSAGSASAGGMPKSASHSPKSSLESAMADVKSSYITRAPCTAAACARRPLPHAAP